MNLKLLRMQKFGMPSILRVASTCQRDWIYAAGALTSSPAIQFMEREIKLRIQEPKRGFTLIELMMAVAIIGLLASLAIPAYVRFVRRSKTSEAVMNVRRMFDGAVTCYQMDGVNREGEGQAPRFPESVGPTPGVDACCSQGGISRCPANSDQFTAFSWNKLNFSVSDPHYYWYTFESQGDGAAAQFTARASGNLDCDDVFSTFERLGYVDLSGGVTGGAGLFRIRPNE